MEVLTIIINVIMAVVAVAALLISGWQTIIKKVRDKAEGIINEAEDTGFGGDAKMGYAVNRIMDALPAAAKLVITRELVEKILQSVFDGMELYAKKQVEKKGG